jgi:protein-tyrosine phosphatase
MSTDPEVTPPPADTPETLPMEPPHVHFSGAHWFLTGIVRLSYRGWTHVAAFLFPEDSKAEHIAQVLHIPLPDKLNMSWITPHLAVGGRIHPEDIKELAAAGVTHVVDTRSEYCDDAGALAKEHIGFLHLPTDDMRPLTIEQMLHGAQWVQERMEQGGRVLIHCEHGVGRSALLTSAVLVYEGMHAYDAMHLVQEKRWQAAPNHRQVKRLREFESTVVASRNA